MEPVRNRVGRTDVGWSFWLQWVMASTTGMLASALIVVVLRNLTTSLLVNLLGDLLGGWWEYAMLAVIGLGVGSMQWMVLRRQVSRASWWILASTIGFAIAWDINSATHWALTKVLDFVANDAVGSPVAGVVGAVVGLAWIGIAQWTVLRRQVSQAGWWILASGVGTIMMLSVGSTLQQEIVAGALGQGIANDMGNAAAITVGWAVSAVITGGVLVWLLRLPVAAQDGTSEEAAKAEKLGTSDTTTMGGTFLVQWVLASTGGWFLLLVLSQVVENLAASIGSFALASVGVARWPILRRQISQPYRWVLASGVGWVVIGVIDWLIGERLVGALGTVFNIALRGVALGTVVGIAQWTVLRRQVSQAGWWILASIAGWGVSMLIAALLHSLTGFFVAGVTNGVIMGAALVWLLPMSALLGSKGRMKQNSGS